MNEFKSLVDVWAMKKDRENRLVGRLLAGLYNVMSGDNQKVYTEMDFIPKKEDEKKEISEDERLKQLSNLNLAFGGKISKGD